VLIAVAAIAGKVEAATGKRIVERLSLATDGTQSIAGSSGDGSTFPSLSADGRFVAFASAAPNLVPGDTNGIPDAFVRDRLTGTTERVSVATGGAQATPGTTSWGSIDPAISADGRFVVFISDATNLVTGDTNGLSDIFLRDRTLGTTVRLSVTSAGVQSTGGLIGEGSDNPSISADGRFIAFTSETTNIVSGDTNTVTDVFVRDRVANTTVRVSVATGGAQATGGPSGFPLISGDGRFIVFQSSATNLVAGDTNGTWDVFVRDRVGGTTERVSVATGGAQGTGTGMSALEAGFPSISADGRFVAFTTDANNLVSNDTNGRADIFVRDRLAGVTERVNVGWFGEEAQGGASNSPSLSADGSFVAFVSSADNLVPGGGGDAQIYLRDRVAATTEHVSIAPGGSPGNGASTTPAISADGRFIAFPTAANNLVPFDTNTTFDVMVSWRIIPSPTRIAVFRPSNSTWFLRGDDGATTSVAFGGTGDVPVPADYFGSGTVQIAVFRPSTQNWYIRTDDNGTNPLQFGGPGDLPVPADYLGKGRAQIAVFRPSTGTWFIRNDDGPVTQVTWGVAGDIPLPGDYFGLGHANLAVFRPSTRQWILRTEAGSAVTVVWGAAGDLPVPGDYFGIGRKSIAVFRPATGEWFLRNDNASTTRFAFGTTGDVPVAGDYLDEGHTQIAVFRPSTREWFVRDSSLEAMRVGYGGPGDVPIPAAYR
jgi:Tol biopolymer transport system component